MNLIEAKHITENQYKEFIECWGSGMIIPSAARYTTENYQEQQNKWAFQETEAVEALGFVPSELYFLEVDKRLVGAIHLRLRLNDFLLLHGGHIGYGVVPSERKKGYANRMMTLLIEKIKPDYDRLLLTCDVDNIGSNKTIQNKGGVLENQHTFEGVLTNRYWINLV